MITNNGIEYNVIIKCLVEIEMITNKFRVRNESVPALGNVPESQSDFTGDRYSI